MKITRILVEDYFNKNNLNEEILTEGWIGAIIGFILGAKTAAIAGGVIGGLTVGITLSSIIGGAIAGTIGVTVLGHKIEEWARYQDRKALVDCKHTKPGKERAKCVLDGLNDIVKSLKIYLDKLEKGSPQWRKVREYIIRYEKDIKKLSRKVKKKI